MESLQGRTVRTRLGGNENDENNATVLTRAKKAALNGDELAMPAKGLAQPKKAATTSSLANAGVQRRRNVLNDVSNVNKPEAANGKKTAAGKSGFVSKAAHPVGVQKSTAARPTTTRSALAAKEPRKAAAVQRTGSGSGSLATAGPKRKVLASTTGTKDVAVESAEPLRKRLHRQATDESVDENGLTDVGEGEAEVDSDAEKPIPLSVERIDQEDWDDPLMVAEYATEIFEYLRDLECRSIPNPQYMSHQDDLEWKTRGILIDWLIEVHTRFHLLPETLFLAVNIIDRFLSEKVVQLDRLQLVGITAMFIASKYEEVLSPHVENFKCITDNGFSEAEILSAERFLLTTLNYDLSYPNPMNFLRRVSKADDYDIQSRTIGKYLMEISLLDHRFMAYRPSHCAAAAMYLARMMLDRGPWVCFAEQWLILRAF